MANISRDGAEKRTQKTFETATPPHVVKLCGVSVPIPGMSRTESSRALEGDKLGVVNDGGSNPATLKEGHKGTPPKVHPSMISQRQREATMDDGNTVLGNAILSGSTKLKPDCPDK
jgi:hypothetical protein